MAIRSFIPVLITMMLVTGVCNTLLTKLQDMECVHNCDSEDRRRRRNFEQPVIQTVQMFIGEMGCWLVVLGFSFSRRLFRASSSLAKSQYRPVPTENPLEATEYTEEERPSSSHSGLGDAPAPLKPLISNTSEDRTPLTGWKTFLLAIPACCDITGTTLMNVGLLFVAASIYQMTRGALVLFVGLFSVLFLKRRLYAYHWFSLFIVVLGVGIVGLAGVLFPDTKDRPMAEDDPFSFLTVKSSIPTLARSLASQGVQPSGLRTIVGILLIAFAQVFTATQFCVEEWILENYALEPLRVVAWEGVFGFTVTVFLQIILHFAVGVTKGGQHGYFDARDGYSQVLNNRVIAITSILIMISIGGFNYFGLSVTRSISATSRSIIDTCRTLFIWIVSLGLGWESFKWLQVLGFAMLVYGTFLFNDLVRPPIRALLPARTASGSRHSPDGRSERLLPEEPIEHM